MIAVIATNAQTHASRLVFCPCPAVISAATTIQSHAGRLGFTPARNHSYPHLISSSVFATIRWSLYPVPQWLKWQEPLLVYEVSLTTALSFTPFAPAPAVWAYFNFAFSLVTPTVIVSAPLIIIHMRRFWSKNEDLGRNGTYPPRGSGSVVEASLEGVRQRKPETPGPLTTIPSRAPVTMSLHSVL